MKRSSSKDRPGLDTLSDVNAPLSPRTGRGAGGEGISAIVAIASIALLTAPDAGGAPATPGPQTVECAVPPRSPESIAELLEQEIATQPATTGGTTLPTGTPAAAALAQRMEILVRQWLACQNAGEPLRAWALFTDRYLYRLLSRQGGMIDQSLATPAPAAGLATIMEIGGQRLLPDGRSGATVTIAYPSIPMPKTFFVYFTEQDGRLLIDGILGEISFAVP
jgi:hypothetical protein